MEPVKFFKNGGSKAMRIPKQYDPGDNVFITKLYGMTILVNRDDPWAGMFEALNEFSDDFLREPIEQLPVQEREGL